MNARPLFCWMAAINSVRVDFLQLMASSTTETILMPILLLPTHHPSPHAETCPITLETIGADTYQPTQCARLLIGPKYAHLLCVELMSCKHRFDARALVAHFLHNGMTCPLCRQGDANTRFDPRATFKGFEVSEWVLSAQPTRAPKRRRVRFSDLMAAILLSDAFDGEETLFRVPIADLIIMLRFSGEDSAGSMFG
jgi:hypothetical protein